MNLNQYQNEAMRTAVYPLDRALEYTVLGLTSEASVNRYPDERTLMHRFGGTNASTEWEEA